MVSPECQAEEPLHRLLYVISGINILSASVPKHFGALFKQKANTALKWREQCNMLVPWQWLYRFQSSGMSYGVVWSIPADVSDNVLPPSSWVEWNKWYVLGKGTVGMNPKRTKPG
jgi:hypothetical protein